MRNSLPLALSGIAPAIPPHPCPSRYVAALRWDRWNQRSDGTHFGAPGGGANGVVEMSDELRVLGGGRQLNTERFSDLLEASRLVSDRESLRT